MRNEARRPRPNQWHDTEYFDGWPDEAIELHWGPVASVSSITSVKYYDTDETLQTLSSSVYELGQRHGMAILRLAYDQSWPTLRGHTADDIVVTYTAGYGDSRSDVPAGIRRWIKARAAWMFENRDGGEFPWTPAMDSLLSPFAIDQVVGATD